MQFGLDVSNMGVTADPRRVVELAVAAEEAGWDGLFMWDSWGYVWDVPTGDQWVILAAVAQATSRLRLGTAITVLPRRRPNMVAHTLATLDLLSGGRMVFGAGLGGGGREFTAFGEVEPAKTRAAMLDEGLEVVAGLLRGEHVKHAGPHYTVDDVALMPHGVQTPRVPIWIGATAGNALRRAARWDGWVIYTVDEHGEPIRTPDDVGVLLATIQAARREADRDQQPYEVVVTGATAPGDSVEAYQAIGATWWLETLHGHRLGFDALMARVVAGPPR